MTIICRQTPSRLVIVETTDLPYTAHCASSPWDTHGTLAHNNSETLGTTWNNRPPGKSPYLRRFVFSRLFRTVSGCSLLY